MSLGVPVFADNTVSDTIFTRSNIGNITGERLVGTGLKTRSYSDAHELTSVGSDLQTFDDDGNLTGHYSGMTMGYDAAGMLESATVDNAAGFRGTVAFGYTADGKRAFKRTTPTDGNAQTRVYVYAGANCVAEYVSPQAAPYPQIEYVYGDGIDSLALIEFNNTTAAVLRNQQWSVTALMDVDNPGTVLERYAYDKFGKRTILTPNGANVRAVSHFSNFYGYTSRRHDVDTGLMYFRARYYDPQTGEFISRDPLEYVDGMSLYRGYFVPGGGDPLGTQLRRPPNDPYKPLPPNPDGQNPDGLIDEDPCSPSFDLHLNPFTPRNAPWKKAVFDGPTYGETEKNVDWSDCFCAKCDCGFKIVNCGMSLEQLISLHVGWIQFQERNGVKVNGTPINLANVYGHEQRHVAANIAAAKAIKAEILAEMRNSPSYETKEECKSKALFLTFKMVQKSKERLAQENPHGANGHPDEGVPMEPIGGIPNPR